MDNPIQFNAARDVEFAHHCDAFDRILHIFDLHWHGIRSATGCLPGRKLGVSHRRRLLSSELRHIEGLIYRHNIGTLCYQGYSETADELVGIIHDTFGDDVRQVAVTHVTAAQFEHQFEMHMIGRMAARIRQGRLHRLGSVKPGFSSVCPEYWSGTLINLPPALPQALPILRSTDAVLIPLENSWRKNLYTNVIAADRAGNVGRILSVNLPSHLDLVTQIPRLKVIGFQTPGNLLGYMASVGLVMNVTFAECQPMAQLEALAVGTPCLTGPLALPGFSTHPLGKLTEIEIVDSPVEMARAVARIIGLWQSDPAALQDMIRDFARLRMAAGIASYVDFLEL